MTKAFDECETASDYLEWYKWQAGAAANEVLKKQCELEEAEKSLAYLDSQVDRWSLAMEQDQ